MRAVSPSLPRSSCFHVLPYGALMPQGKRGEQMLVHLAQLTIVGGHFLSCLTDSTWL